MSWQRRIRSVLEPYQLTHVQFVLLTSLWWLTDHEDQPPSQARLAQHAGTDPMMTSQVTRRLEARGLLQRAHDPADSRARRLLLTAAGRDLVAPALQAVESADEAYFASLGPQRGEFLQTLQSLATASMA